MPRDKSKKFLKQKYAQQHKKTPARKHEHEDDIGLPAPIHHLDDAVSKRRNKKNKYASQSHKDERIKTEGSDEEDNHYNNNSFNNNYPDDHDRNYTPLAMGTSTEEILQSFEKDQPTGGNGYDHHGYSQSYDYSNHTTPRYSGGAADDYNNIDINSNISRKQRRTRSMHSLSSVHTSALWPVAEMESLDVSMSTMTGARSTAADDENDTISDVGSASVSDLASQSEQMQEPLEQASAIQNMDTHLEALGSKDSIERIEALEKITHLLCRRFFDDYFSANMDKLSKCSEMLIQCLKKGDAAEQCLTLQVIALLVTTVQNDMSSFVQEIRPVLIKLILEAMNTRVQSMAISAFTYLVWLSDNTSHVQSTLHFLEKLWKAPMRNEAKPPASAGSLLSPATVEEEKEEKEEKEQKGQVSNGTHSNDHQEETRNSEDKEDEREQEADDSEKYFKKSAAKKQSDNEGEEEEENEQKSDLFSNVHFTKLLNANAKSKAVALQHWTWLISGLSIGGIASLLDAFEPELIPLLQANELSLRCASGEALTLLITNYKEAVTNQDIVEEFELQPVEWNHVVEAFITLRDGTDKKRKASEVRRQRREFRDFISSITEDWKPEVTVRLQNASIELKGWNECISYHRVKDIIGSGLQLHLMENSKLQNRLQIEVEELAPQKSKDEKEKKQKTFKRSARLQKESRKKQRQTKNAFRFEPADNETTKRK